MTLGLSLSYMCEHCNANGFLATSSIPMVPLPGTSLVGFFLIFMQRKSVDHGETFGPVVKPPTICVVLDLATSQSWVLHLLDVKHAFLDDSIQETVYCL